MFEPFRIVDLGVHLDQAAYPPWGFKSQHVDHARGAAAMAEFLNLRDFAQPAAGGAKDGRGASGVARGDFPEALGLAWSQVQMSDHAGNHIDAPWHFGPTVAGAKAKTIDEVPLEWCCGPGVRLDVRAFKGRDVGRADLERELDRIGVALAPGMIPLLWTGADETISDDKRYWEEQAGLSEEGLHFLLDRGVKLVGIDAYAMDVSNASMKQSVASGDPRLFPLHFVGRAREHMHLEKLANLGRLPRPSGFLFVAFPVKLRGGSAGWVRPVALVPEAHFAQSGGRT
jgi:kynurenine formamidase